MFAFVTIVEPQFDSVNAARKGALKSHIFGAPKAGDRWNAPVLCSLPMGSIPVGVALPEKRHFRAHGRTGKLTTFVEGKWSLFGHSRALN